jgi:hypothetical protein
VPAWLLLTCAAASAQTVEKKIDSYLYEPSYQLDNHVRGQARAYVPQPGDVLLATDPNWFWALTHDIAGAGEPHNSAIIVQRRDGRLGVLEAGPNDCVWVKIEDLLPHLKEYADKGPVWIRKRKTPLTAEQNALMMEWAEKQEGKRFALGRLLVLITPFRDRGPLRTEYLGKPHGDRSSFYCAELVLETCVAAGLIERETSRPSATYPHDLFFDHSYNRYISKHLPLVHDWEPPARWLDRVVDGVVEKR